MRKASLEELTGQVAAGEYAVDAAKVAGVILAEFALVRRVSRMLVDDTEPGEAAVPGRAPRPRRRVRQVASRPISPWRERLY